MKASKRYDEYIDSDCDKLLRDIDTGKLRVGKYADIVSTKNEKGVKSNGDKKSDEHQSQQREQQDV